MISYLIAEPSSPPEYFMEASQCSRKHVGELQKPNKERFSRRKELNCVRCCRETKEDEKWEEAVCFLFVFLSGPKCPLGAQFSSMASKGTGVGALKVLRSDEEMRQLVYIFPPLSFTYEVWLIGTDWSLLSVYVSTCVFIIHSKIIIFLNHMPFLLNADHVILELEGL